MISMPRGYVQPPGEAFRARISIRPVSLPGADEAQIGLGTVDRNELERDLRRYYETYYAELDARMSRYRAMHEIFPDRMIGPRCVVAVLATDGIEVTHWFAQQQSFEFRPSADRMVRDTTSRERYVQAPGGMWADLFDYEPGVDFGAFEFWGFSAIENGTVIESEWARLDVASLDNLESFRDEAQARANAERDVQISADAYLMGLDPAPILPDQAQQNRLIAEIEAAVDEFEKVLEVHANDEKMIQLYLDAKRNRILLEPSMMPTLRREVWIGNKKADFVVELPPGERYLLVEIERPIHRLFTGKDRVTAEVTHAQQQIEDWMNRISEHPHEARETLPGIREPQGWVVIGRRSSMTEHQQTVLERRNARHQNITIMTYDDLLDRAKQHLANLRNM